MDQATLSIAFKMTVALGAVLLTFGISVWVARKFSSAKGNLFKKNAKSAAKPLEILAYQSLGPGKNLYLIRCFDRRVLVGATNAQISHVLDVEESFDESADDYFDGALESKMPENQERKLKKDFGSSLKDIARV